MRHASPFRFSRTTRARARFHVELLEDRTLLTVFTVTHTRFTDIGSLFWAIERANQNAGHDTIDFNITGAGVQTIVPRFQFPIITESVVIDATTQPGWAPDRPMIALDGSQMTAGNGLEFQVGGNTVKGLVVQNFPWDGLVFAEMSVPNPVGGNVIQGNFLGTDAGGTVAMGNGFSGLKLADSPNNTIGGTAPGQGNLLSGNDEAGLSIDNAVSANNTIVGNRIGTDITGNAALPNDVGVFLSRTTSPPGFGFASHNFIGSPRTGTGNVLQSGGNVISGNTSVGVYVLRGTDNTIQNNHIGVGVDGVTPVSNGWDGVVLEDASGNVVGGVAGVGGNLISANGRSGVKIEAISRGASVNHVLGNLIGTNASGEFGPGLGNGRNGVDVDGQDGVAWKAGVEIRNSSADPSVTVAANVIGLGDADDGALDNVFTARNVISGNFGGGILLVGRVFQAQIQANFIGTNKAGTAAVNNFGPGIELNALAATDQSPVATVIGGSTLSGEGNVVSGNDEDGILIANGSSLTFVQGNRIGITADGRRRLGNGRAGVAVTGSSDNVIGSTLSAGGFASDEFRNVISANSFAGVAIVGSPGTAAARNDVISNYVGTDISGVADPDQSPGSGDELGNEFGVVVQNAFDNSIGVSDPSFGGGNTIAGSRQDGVVIAGALSTGNRVQGNTIGGLALGHGLGNRTGIRITRFAGEADSPSQNFIGGTQTANGAQRSLGNTISANLETGIAIHNGSHHNHVVGNAVGTSLGLPLQIGNGGDGVSIIEAPENVIGGRTDAARNYIVNNGGNGILIRGAAASINHVIGNYIGVPIGIAPVSEQGNVGNGVLIEDAPVNFVGTGAPGAGNVISGNGGSGVRVTGTPSDQISNARLNAILGNYIGTNADGTAAVPNQAGGVLIQGDVIVTRVGGPSPLERNVISGNEGGGVGIFGIFGVEGVGGNLVVNNYIGTDATGTSAVPNKGDGVHIETSASNDVGGDTAAAGNVISGNQGSGVFITGAFAAGNKIKQNHIGIDPSSTVPIPNRVGITLTNNAQGDGPSKTLIQNNFISKNLKAGIRLVNDGAISGGVRETEIFGNLLVRNVGFGILVDFSPDNRIGGTDGTRRNVIVFTTPDPANEESYTTGHGIYVRGPFSTDNTISGNLVSGNEGTGIKVGEGASSNDIGLPLFGGGNVVNRNAASGIDITDPDTRLNVVQGNVVGLTDAGEPAGNGLAGVRVSFGAHDNQIGGTSLLARNIVSANQDGVRLFEGAHHNEVLGNFVGTDLTGAFAAGLGNTVVGVAITNARDNTIGGETDAPGARPGSPGNTIFGNGIGVGLSGATTRGNTVRGNLVSRNTQDGVQVINGATGNVIGGAAARHANRISDNTRAGVSVQAGTGLTVRRNHVVANGGLGIDLGADGVTPNDGAKDPDSGPNQLQNYPDLAFATVGGSRRARGDPQERGEHHLRHRGVRDRHARRLGPRGGRAVSRHGHRHH
jgi:hypothetical protein